MLKESYLPTNLLNTVKLNWNELTQPKDFEIFPQMPTAQLSLFAKQAAHKDYNVVIQTNPCGQQQNVQEIKGTIRLSVQSGHLIVTKKHSQIVHLLHPQTIRHIRREI